jgi:hypothetical protein
VLLIDKCFFLNDIFLTGVLILRVDISVTLRWISSRVCELTLFIAEIPFYSFSSALLCVGLNNVCVDWQIIALAFLMKAQWWSHFAGLDRFGWVPTVNGHPVWVFFFFNCVFFFKKKNCGQQWRIRRRLDVVKLGTTRISYLTFYIRWQFWAQTL